MVTFLVWIAFIFSAKENKRESHEQLCEKKVFCNVAMPSEGLKIVEFNQ